MSLWSGSTDPKTLDYLRTYAREHQIARRHTKETTAVQDPASPGHQQQTEQEASSKRQTERKHRPSVSRQRHHPTPPYPSEEEHTDSAQVSPYEGLTHATAPTSSREKPKGRKNSTVKPGKRRPQTQ